MRSRAVQFGRAPLRCIKSDESLAGAAQRAPALNRPHSAGHHPAAAVEPSTAGHGNGARQIGHCCSACGQARGRFNYTICAPFAGQNDVVRLAPYEAAAAAARLAEQLLVVINNATAAAAADAAARRRKLPPDKAVIWRRRAVAYQVPV